MTVKKTVAKKAPVGYIPIPETVEKLAATGMTKAEICRLLGKPKHFLQDNCKDEYARGSMKIVEQLRAKQLDVALNDRNVAMLIHLGKFFLGQRETQQIEVKKVDDTLKDVSTDDLIALVKSDGNK